MNYSENQKSVTKIYFRVGIVLFIVGLIFLWIDYATDFQLEWMREMAVMVYLMTFGGGLFSFTGVYLRKQWEKDIVNIATLTMNEQTIYNASRVMFDAKMSFFGHYVFFSLDGEKLAEVKQMVPPDEKWLRILLSVVRLDRFLDETYYIQTGRKTYTLRKPQGWNRPYILKDEDDNVIAGYKNNSKLMSKLQIMIAEANGEVSGIIEQGMSQEEQITSGNDGKQWLRIRIGGIPREAMELFASGHAHIVDIYKHSQTDDERMKLIAIPIVCQQFYVR